MELGDWNVSTRRIQFRPDIDLRGKRADEAMEMAKGVALNQYMQYGIPNVPDEYLENFASSSRRGSAASFGVP